MYYIQRAELVKFDIVSRDMDKLSSRCNDLFVCAEIKNFNRMSTNASKLSYCKEYLFRIFHDKQLNHNYIDSL